MRRKKISPIPFLALILFPFCLLGAGILICCDVKAFNVFKIHSNLAYNEYWNMRPLTSSQNEHLKQHILRKTFYYFNAAPHYYAFVDQDRQYIIKFFRKNHLSPKEWLKRQPLALLRYFGYEELPDDHFFSEHLFTNYMHANNHFREETGLVYLHLNKYREFKRKLKLIDAKGHAQLVDLNSCAFVIQKCAEDVFDYLDNLAHQGDLKAFRSGTRDLLRLIATRCEKGFACPNLPLHNHFGFVDHKPIQYNCGLLSKDLSMSSPTHIQTELVRTAEKLTLWARDHHPHLVPLIQEETAFVLKRETPDLTYFASIQQERVADQNEQESLEHEIRATDEEEALHYEYPPS